MARDNSKKLTPKQSLAMLGIIGAIIGGIAYSRSETKEDVDRKPQLAQLTLDFSAAACGYPDASGANYKARLRPLLMEAYSSTLESINNMGVAVCLDRRLGNQHSGFADATIYGAYYNGKFPSISLWDNGVAFSDSGPFTSSAYTYGAQTLDAFVKRVNDRTISLTDNFDLAGRYGGKSKYMDWERPADFDQDSLRKNRAILTPTIR